MYAPARLLAFTDVAITVTVNGVSMFGDALRDILDPRLRGAVGQHG